MCNRARFHGEPETLFSRFDASWAPDIARPNKEPRELYPERKAYVIREDRQRRVVDLMAWDVLGGGAKWAMTNVRNLALPQWRALAAEPGNRCLVPLTAFAEFTPDKHDLGDGKPPLKGEMWFSVTDQPVFAVAGFWQMTAKGPAFAMVTCDPNALVEPIHPKAMITILAEGEWGAWLQAPYDQIVTLQRPYPAVRMTVEGPVFPTRGRCVGLSTKENRRRTRSAPRLGS